MAKSVRTKALKYKFIEAQGPAELEKAVDIFLEKMAAKNQFSWEITDMVSTNNGVMVVLGMKTPTTVYPEYYEDSAIIGNL